MSELRRIARRWRGRGWTSVLNLVRGLLPTLTLAAAAWLTIERTAEGVLLWGQFVAVSVPIAVAVALVSFGDRDYLLQQFAKRPSQATPIWRRCWSSRLPLLVLAVLSVWSLHRELAAWSALWLVGAVLAQSQEALLLFRKRVRLSALGELAVGLALLVWLGTRGEDSLGGLVTAFAVAAAARGVVRAVIAQSGSLSVAMRSSANPGLRPLRDSWPFFLIGFAGFLHSRIDLILVTALATPAERAAYQIALNVLVGVQTSLALSVAPLAGVLQRLPSRTTVRLASLSSLGLVVLLVLVYPWSAEWLLNGAFGLELSRTFLLVGALWLLPTVGLVFLFYALVGQGAQLWLAGFGYVAAVVNAALTAILLPDFGILGALIGGMAANWLSLVLVLWRSLRRRSAGTDRSG